MYLFQKSLTFKFFTIDLGIENCNISFLLFCSEEIVVVVATAIAILDVLFIMVCVPESLPDKCRPVATTRGLTFDQVIVLY